MVVINGRQWPMILMFNSCNHLGGGWWLMVVCCSDNIGWICWWVVANSVGGCCFLVALEGGTKW